MPHVTQQMANQAMMSSLDLLPFLCLYRLSRTKNEGWGRASCTVYGIHIPTIEPSTRNYSTNSESTSTKTSTPCPLAGCIQDNDNRHQQRGVVHNDDGIAKERRSKLTALLLFALLCTGTSTHIPIHPLPHPSNRRSSGRMRQQNQRDHRHELLSWVPGSARTAHRR